MASRRFFAYDPYDYYYASPYHQYYQQPAPPRGAGGFFPAAAPEPETVAPRPWVESSSRPPVSIPVHFVGSDPDPERVTTARIPPLPQPAVAPVPTKRAPSAEAAAVRVQAVARGFLARRSLRAVREVEREAAEVGGQIAREAAALRGDARARVAVGEALMRMLLRLDAVRGAREYRRKVTKRVLALQDAVDALEATPAPAPVTEAVAEGNESYDVTAKMAGESAAASELPDVAERSGEMEAEVAAEMEVDGDAADGEPEQAGQDAGILVVGGKTEGAGTEGEEWEMVTEETEPAEEPPATACPEAPQPQEPVGAEIRTAAEGGAAAGGDGGLDARKVMEMVVALCERTAQQCAVIGALAERVDTLERAVRRVEDAERRWRRAKKMRKEGRKGSNHNSNSKCYSD